MNSITSIFLWTPIQKIWIIKNSNMRVILGSYFSSFSLHWGGSLFKRANKWTTLKKSMIMFSISSLEGIWIWGKTSKSRINLQNCLTLTKSFSIILKNITKSFKTKMMTKMMKVRLKISTIRLSKWYRNKKTWKNFHLLSFISPQCSRR